MTDREHDPLASIVAEFGADDVEVDRGGALVHAKAMTILAASQKPVNEETYAAALNAVSSSTARSTNDGELAERMRGAEALSNAAMANLRARGVFSSASGYETAYVAEVERVAKASGLTYYYKERT